MSVRKFGCVACYIRVSTQEQNDESQVAELRRWLKAQGIDDTAVLWFVDKESGDTLDRPGFDTLQQAIFRGEIKTVVVYKLCRVGRSLQDGINVLCDWLGKGVRLVSVTQQFDFSGTIGKMVASLLFGFAEFEQETRRERQAAGISVAKQKGIYKGRKPGAVKRGVDPSRAAQLRGRGLTHEEIAMSLGISISTARRYLAQTAD